MIPMLQSEGMRRIGTREREVIIRRGFLHRLLATTGLGFAAGPAEPSPRPCLRSVREGPWGPGRRPCW